ncbi:nucleotide exchange factor GrpE [Nitratiruptor sp. SB155-2]|uniref:Protein GrpE n=1 Tax=Nitratiruptor sp. (strain SB155-2) TaxID=387092 RepID=GRPE_NITSB|nr:nucleotide exchange factor GrpE [Nitratiruptor sp. SB155-2]A6Q422.1 RecName: Full=Protein GrpE; AltName: Full=HSP-70 cofactor [Nitratiruptor sp. SB155-2]BAF70231.1 co-chaperone protein GrpE [Nitratiruptor sp. SB155-2]
MAEKKRAQEQEKVQEDQKMQNEQNECEEVEKKLQECEEKYLRVHADFENTKKRLEREKIQAIEYSLEKFAQDLLPALDSLDMALAAVSHDNLNAEEAVKELKKGIELTIDQFIKAFNKNGIEVIEIEEGGEFNPHLHEAILQVDDAEKKAGQIVQVIQKGYKYKERILRPAKVSVAKGNE